MELEEQPERAVLAMSAQVVDGDVGAALGQVLPQVYRHIQNLGVVPETPPFARFVDGGRSGAIEAGLGVPAGTPGAGPIASTSLPAGSAAVAWHHGDYGGLADAWAALRAAIDDSPWEPAGAGWEIYWDAPGQSALDELRTQLVIPVRARAAEE